MKPPETDPGPRGDGSGGPPPGDEEGRELRRALAARAETARPREPCPDPDSLWRAVAGELPPQDTRDLVDHLAGCPACAEIWRLAMDLRGSGEVGRGEEEAGAEGRTSPARVLEMPPQATDAEAVPSEEPEGFWGPWLQTAAIVLLLAGAAVLLPRGLLEDRPDLMPSVERGDDAGLEALVPQDRPLGRGDLVLRWSEPEAGLTYDVEVLWPTEGGTARVLSARDLDRPRLPLPEERLEALPPGSVLLWEVAARRDGEEVARRTFTLRLGDR